MTKTRLSTKRVKEILNVISTFDIQYRLTRWEHPSGDGYRYSYCIIKVFKPDTNEQKIEYLVENTTLKHCYNVATELLKAY